ncbi:MAG: hypothetical protein M3016_08840 [Actinomycetota bacterium]|nr:hypothetical protein [Actinomycetota bacterium]
MSVNGALAIATFGLLIVTGFYAWWTRAMVRELRRQWRDERREAADQDRSAELVHRRGLVRAALYEVRANLHLAPSLHIHHAWLSIDTKEVDALARELPATSSAFPALVEVRTNVLRYNSAAAYSNEKVRYASGAMDDLLDGTRQQVVDVIKLLQVGLENLDASFDGDQVSGASWGS